MAKSSGRTSGQHSFAQIPRAEIQRSKFNRSCGLKTTFNAGLLIPVFVDEILPGDTVNLRMNTFARLATPLKPLMDNMWLDSHFFFVPNRLLWANWEKQQGQQENPGDSTDFLIPQVTSQADTPESLSDYFGIPQIEITHSAMWHRAYNRIWRDWFRSQDLQDSPVINTDDGPDDIADYPVLRRGKRHDYFTSGLPAPSKGPPVLLPLGGEADVHTSAENQATNLNVFMDFDSTYHTMDSGTSTLSLGDTVGPEPPNGRLFADLASATAATINEIREAFQLQRLFERDARGGTRYTEMIRSHFGVTSPDSRLQRAEYLGGGSQRITVTPVPQTSETDPQGPDASPQGNLAAYGTSTGSNHSFTKSFTEHGVIIGLVSVRADLNYQQGLDQMFSRRTRFDHFMPVFSHLGETPIRNKEIFATGAGDSELETGDEGVFAYQEAWATYRYKASKITGLMRSSHPQSLDVWHLAQDFQNLPTLGKDFIEDNPPIDRVIAVPSEPHFLFDAYFEFTHARAMPTYSVPGMIDHF